MNDIQYIFDVFSYQITRNREILNTESPIIAYDATELRFLTALSAVVIVRRC